MSQAAAGASKDDLERLDEALKQLRVAYEKYFAGVERVEPLKERDAVKKMLRRLTNEQTNNTARRFRIQGLQASLVTYEQHWNRITRQIEEGTFKRDKLRAEKILRDGATSSEPAPAAAAPAGEKPSRQYPEPIRKLHEAYVAAKRQVGDNQAVSIDSFAATVSKQYAAIKAKYNCATVDFQVTVKEGRAILKAVPR